MRETEESFKSFLVGGGDEKYSKQSFSMFTWNVTKTAFMSLTASLEELLYFFFLDGSIFL